MTKTSKICLAVITVFVCLFVCLWINNKAETKVGYKTITINVNHLNAPDTTFTVSTNGEYLSDALNSIEIVSGEITEYGLYINTVDDEKADKSLEQWWGYEINGEMAMYGVDQQPIADGDVIDFTLNVGY